MMKNFWPVLLIIPVAIISYFLGFYLGVWGLILTVPFGLLTGSYAGQLIVKNLEASSKSGW